MSYVYFVKCNEFCKIGVTEEPNVRISAMQTGCPYELKLIGTGCTEKRHEAETMENILHDLFYDSWVRGEWFKAETVEEWLYGDLKNRRRITNQITQRRTEARSCEYWSILDEINKTILAGDMHDYHRRAGSATSAMLYKSSLSSNKWGKHKCTTI